MPPLVDRIGFLISATSWCFVLAGRLIEEVNTVAETALVIIGAVTALVGLARGALGVWRASKRLDILVEHVVDMDERFCRVEEVLELESWQDVKHRREIAARRAA